jgi:hypothetical protein
MRRRDRRDDGANSVLGATPSAQAVELGLEIALLLPLGGPSRLDERRLEPVRALSHAGGSLLTCAFVVARAQAGPRDEMGFGGIATHVDADFRDDRLRGQVAHARNRGQEPNRVAKGIEVRLNPQIDASDQRLERVDLAQVQFEPPRRSRRSCGRGRSSREPRSPTPTRALHPKGRAKPARLSLRGSGEDVEHRWQGQRLASSAAHL